jgi:hypothetical protein
VAGRLDVGEEDLLVGGEARSCELRVLGIVVAREEERLAALGRADEVLLAVAVLGDDQPP